MARRSKSLAPTNKSGDRGQTYLSDISLKVMWEKQRTALLPPPQSEELMELKLDGATGFVAALTGERHD